MSVTYVDERELKRAYQAGIFDGEGHCHRAPGTLGLRIGISQANYVFCESFQLEFGGGVHLHNAACWQWNVSSAAEQLIFLRAISPYLKIRAREVTIAIEICKLTPTRGIRSSLKNIVLRERLFKMLDEAAELRAHAYMERPDEAVA